MLYNRYMDAKLLRGLIYLFLGLIALILLLLLVNFIGARLRPLPPEEKRDNVADSYLQGRYTSPQVRPKIQPDPEELPSARSGLSPAAAGTMMVVKNKSFSGVAEKPRDPLAELQKKSEERNKPAPISIKDLSGAVVSPSSLNKTAPVSGGEVPELGRGEAMEGVTLVKAEVGYKLFKSREIWLPFSEARSIKDAAADFKTEDMLILVPGGEYPAGIFSVESVEKGAAETTVKYRVNPLAMAAGAEDAVRDRYAFSPVPKNKKIKLLQVP